MGPYINQTGPLLFFAIEKPVLVVWNWHLCYVHECFVFTDCFSVKKKILKQTPPFCGGRGLFAFTKMITAETAKCNYLYLLLFPVAESLYACVCGWSESDYPCLGKDDQECSFAHPISQERALATAAGNVEMAVPAFQRSQEAALKALA